MPTADVKVVLGPARSGKTRHLLDGYLRALDELPPGAAMWIAPTWRAADAMRCQLTAQRGRAVLAPGITTFERLAESVLAHSDRPIRPLGRTLKRALLRRLVEEAESTGRLKRYATIARTDGFIDLLESFISDMKRLEIWPEQLAAKRHRRRSTAAKQKELAHLYAAYQECLNRYDYYDAEGRFWTARELLADGQQRPLERLQHVVVDAFADFTHTQHEILQLLAGRIRSLEISLPLDADLHIAGPTTSDVAQRRALFAKPLATLDQLRARHAELTIEPIERRAASDWPAIDRLERGLFAARQVSDAQQDVERIEITAAGQVHAEIKRVARRIKRLLLSGDEQSATLVRPSDVVVVFRNVEDVARRVQEVFDEYGIPCAIESPARLNAAPVITALRALLHLSVEDWPYRAVLAVLANERFQPEPFCTPSTRSATERTIRELQIPKGRRSLLARVARFASEAPEGDAPPEADNGQRDRRQRQEAAQALPWLEWLDAQLSGLPQRATAAGWSQALASLDCLHFANGPSADGEVRARGDSIDRAAWQKVQEILAALGALDQGAGSGQREFDQRELLRMLDDMARSESLVQTRDETDRVRILSAASARGLSIPYLFVASLSEHVFPQPPQAGRLLTDDEIDELIQLDLPLRHRTEHISDELLLFYEVVTRADRYLHLSYPALNAKAEPLLPSPYIQSVKDVLGPQLRITERHDLSPVPQDGAPLSLSEWRIVGVHDALAGKPDRLQNLLFADEAADLAASITSGFRLHDARNHREFSAYEGLLTVHAHGALKQSFGADHVWSADQLARYGYCPFRFFAESILSLEPLPQLELATDPLRRGSVAHEVLAAIHRRANETSGGPASVLSIDADEFNRWLRGELAGRLSSREETPSVGDTRRYIERRELERDLLDYSSQHARYDTKLPELDEALAPAHFEVSFGLSPENDDDDLSTSTPLRLKSGDDEILVGGRIDRLDVGRRAGHIVFNVIDYKTGRSIDSKRDAARTQNALQLRLYAVAASEVLFTDGEAELSAAGYWRIAAKKSPGFSPAGASATPLAKLRDALAAEVGALVSGVRLGEFPVVCADEKCTANCELRTICRVGAVRVLEKQWRPPTTTSN